jgi:hypothetical protein
MVVELSEQGGFRLVGLVAEERDAQVAAACLVLAICFYVPSGLLRL